MKRNYLISFAVIVTAAALLIATLPARAHTDGEAHTHTETTTTETVSPEKQRTERVEKRKAEVKTALTTVQQKRVQTRCKGAQTLLAINAEKAAKIQTNRDKIHTDILDKLTKLEVKLATGGVDTTTFKEQIASLKTKVETFKTDSAAYLQTVQDTAALDCQADPVGFKASLEASRAALKKLQTDAVAIRTTLAQEIKPRLAAAKAQLETKKAE